MYREIKLKNNLQVVTVPMRGTKTITVLVIVGTGSKYENKKNNGISHFLEHMFFKGTRKRPSTLAISEELDSVGGEYNAFTAKEYTGYWVKVDSSKIELALDIVSDMLLNSKMDTGEIEREKGVIIEEIKMYHDNPMMYIEDVFESCLYGDTPAGREIIGSKKNILAFKRNDFIDYISTQYSAGNTTVCLAGRLQNKDSLINKYFSKLKYTDIKDKIKTRELQTIPNIKLHYKKTDQATLSLGLRTFPINHKDEFILRILSIILGGSMSSRMFTEVRERRGLAYYVRTQSEFYTDTGYITTQAGVPVNKVEEAIKTILNEYKKITKTLVSDKELKRAKDLVKGRSVIQLESSDNMASWYARQAVIRGKIITPEELIKRINKVTPGSIRQVAKDVFQNKGLNLAVIGPFKDGKKFSKIVKL